MVTWERTVGDGRRLTRHQADIGQAIRDAQETGNPTPLLAGTNGSAYCLVLGAGKGTYLGQEHEGRPIEACVNCPVYQWVQERPNVPHTTAARAQRQYSNAPYRPSSTPVARPQ